MVAKKYQKAADYLLNPKGTQKKFKVDPKEFALGMKIEMEHTQLRWVAERIVLNHLAEFPNYYTNLVAMEKRLAARKKGGK